QAMSSKLAAWTGGRWMVSVAEAPAEPTITETKRAAERAAIEEASAHPLVAAALKAFPGARITSLRDMSEEAPAEPEEEDDYGDDWSPVDPFAG
ncbi:MAG: DNA polymerase III subunit gamma/tau, partial [Paracoccaceae bacterium]